MSRQTLSNEDRISLAAKLILALKAAGAVERQVKGGEELQFCMRLKRVQVVCYTSIVNGRDGYTVRDLARDAIRIVVMYRSRSGVIRILSKEQRVNRVGTPDRIVERTMARFNAAWDTIKNGPGCMTLCDDCGAPMARSKRGKMYCAEICWKG